MRAFCCVLLLANGLWAQSAPDPPERAVSWQQLFPNIVDDQKLIWTFPIRIFENHNWVPVLVVSGVTAGLIAADPSTGGYFRRTTAFHSFNSIFSGSNTALATAIAPLSFYALALVRKDTHAQKTALLAGEAVADAEILAIAMKAATRRVRPQDLPAHSKFGDTWFEGKATSGSFPSAHAMAAFSIAAVFARRYPRHRWVPFAAYGLAGLVSFSRITLSAHFPADVFMGAALGYSISRFSVLRQ